MPDNTSDAVLMEILTEMKVVAMVGISKNPVRASHFVARYLVMRGVRVIPVNPAYEGEMLFGEPVRAAIRDIPAEVPVDLLDLFRRAEHVPALAEEALDHLPSLKTVWMQLGIRSPEAAEMARARGVRVVEDRCPKIERQRLFGELRRAGINTGIVSSKLPARW